MLYNLLCIVTNAITEQKLLVLLELYSMDCVL
jgi:hypothetical protein